MGSNNKGVLAESAPDKQESINWIEVMKRCFHLLLVALAAAPPAIGQDSTHEQCLKAADYKGCVEVLSGRGTASNSTAGINNLKSSMRLLPSRLSNTSLQDFTISTQVFHDSLAAIDPSSLKSEYEKELYEEAQAISRMVAALQVYWSTRINRGTYYGSYGYKSYYCNVLQSALSGFNSVAGYYFINYSGYITGGGFLNPKQEKCYPQEADMVGAITRRVNAALIDPEERKAQIEKARREGELAKLGPWLRYLEENPEIKKWAEANPKAAEAEKEKFLKKQSAQASP